MRPHSGGASSRKAPLLSFLALQDKAIAVWLQWLVAVHRPRRIARIHARNEMRKRTAKRNATLAASRHSLAIRAVAVAAGGDHSLALRLDGSIACLGKNDDGQAPHRGVDGDFVAVAAGYAHSLALRRDGSIACWGRNGDGQAPPDGVDGDFIAIAAGPHHSLALRRDGSVACWGKNSDGQAPPTGVDGDFIAISAGSWHSLALRRDGSIACWGDNVLGCAPTEEDDTARLNSTPFMTEVHVL